MKNHLLPACFILLSFYSFAAPPTVTSFIPASAASGMTVTITGTNFTGATDVSFGGTPASSFIVVASTQITAIVAIGTSGSVQVTTGGGSGAKAGFTYVPTSAIITDYQGFWSSTGASPNAVVPDNSHNLLAFTYNGVTYSTGANNSLLTNQSVAYTAGNYRALPVAGITGTTGATSTYLALAKKVDGSANIANAAMVSNYSVKSVLTDGINGLDLGTGVTNLPTAAVLTFQISNINSAAITDAVPDIILTQIAQPVAGNDQFSFIDASGTVVGNTISQDMTLLPLFGTYALDLFNLTPATPYNTATAFSAFSANTTREIRVAALRLSEFGITAGNVSQVKALRITPSGNSDYAFIAYNADAINLPPNITQNASATNSTICSGGSASLAVLATPVAGGTLTYAWQESTDGGTNWSAVINGGNYSGAATNKLVVANAVNTYRYRATVTESGNVNNATSADFIITVSAPTAPAAASISGSSATCLNTAIQLTSSVTGGSNLFYQWQTNASGSYANIPDANINSYIPPVNQTGSVSYRLQVSSGSGCSGGVTSSPIALAVVGVSSITPAATCSSGSLSLSATATSGTLDWYSADAGGASLLTGNSYTTPALSSTQTYYVATSGCTALRVPVVATIYPSTAGGTIAGGTTVLTGTNSTTLTLNGNTGDVQKWQSSTDGFSVLVADIPNTTNQLTVTNLTQNTGYRALVQSGSCPGAFSSAASIFVSSTLAIHSGSVKAIPVAAGIRVEWVAYNQQDIKEYIVERSEDGVRFTELHITIQSGATNADVQYQWVDDKPIKGNNFYRVKEVYNTGSNDYSSTIKVFFDNARPGISIYPNPVTARIINIQMQDIPAGNLQLLLINSAGQAVHTTKIYHGAGSNTQSLNLPNKLPAGIYRVEIINRKGIKYTSQLLVL